MKFDSLRKNDLHLIASFVLLSVFLSFFYLSNGLSESTLILLSSISALISFLFLLKIVCLEVNYKRWGFVICTILFSPISLLVGAFFVLGPSPSFFLASITFLPFSCLSPASLIFYFTEYRPFLKGKKNEKEIKEGIY